MKNTITLTESELVDLIKNIISEHDGPSKNDEFLQSLIDTEVRLFSSIEQKGFVLMEVTIKSATMQSEGVILMDVDARPNLRHMPGNPGPFREKMIFDCSKTGLEIVGKKKNQTYYNKGFENHCQVICSNPKPR